MSGRTGLPARVGGSGVIAVDSSAIVAVVRGEPEAGVFWAALLERDCVVGAPTVQEAHMVLLGAGARAARQFLDEVLAGANVEVVPFDAAHLDAAREAFDRYGRRRHPAALNYGDCLAYAVAKVAGAPLLYKGEDFALTDLRPAYVPPGGASTIA